MTENNNTEHIIENFFLRLSREHNLKISKDTKIEKIFFNTDSNTLVFLDEKGLNVSKNIFELVTSKTFIDVLTSLLVKTSYFDERPSDPVYATTILISSAIYDGYLISLLKTLEEVWMEFGLVDV